MVGGSQRPALLRSYHIPTHKPCGCYFLKPSTRWVLNLSLCHPRGLEAQPRVLAGSQNSATGLGNSPANNQPFLEANLPFL